jgi:hypothetical protein
MKIEPHSGDFFVAKMHQYDKSEPHSGDFFVAKMPRHEN